MRWYTVAFRADHVQQLEENPIARMLSATADEWRTRTLDRTAFTVMYDGRPVACGGIATHWPGRGEAWAVVSVGLRLKQVQAVVQTFRRAIEECAPKRLEAVVAVGFVQGHRFVEALGFGTPEGVMHSYFQDGSDAVLYARVRR